MSAMLLLSVGALVVIALANNLSEYRWLGESSTSPSVALYAALFLLPVPWLPLVALASVASRQGRQLRATVKDTLATTLFVALPWLVFRDSSAPTSFPQLHSVGRDATVFAGSVAIITLVNIFWLRQVERKEFTKRTLLRHVVMQLGRAAAGATFALLWTLNPVASVLFLLVAVAFLLSSHDVEQDQQLIFDDTVHDRMQIVLQTVDAASHDRLSLASTIDSARSAALALSGAEDAAFYVQGDDGQTPADKTSMPENRLDDSLSDAVHLSLTVNSTEGPLGWLVLKQPHFPTSKTTQDMLIIITRQVANSCEASASKHETAFLTHHDALTGLVNRASLASHLDRLLDGAKRSKVHVSVMVINLNNFKDINDLHGYEAGDALLCSVAGILMSMLHENDMCARVGGDEFIVVLNNAQNSDATAFSLRLENTVASTIFRTIDNIPMRSSCSAGLATYPADGLSQDRLLGVAKHASYAAKKSR